MAITFNVLQGESIAPFLNDIARLRIEVFREFPYLYEGNEDYERNYLQKYLECSASVIVLAHDQDTIVGVSSGLPLTAADEAFRAPFRGDEYRPGYYYYFGESVLRQDYRGKGIGHEFFNQRETIARQEGYLRTTFCAVDRPRRHPLRPANYRPLDDFWAKRGYRKQPQMTCRFDWKDIGDKTETSKTLTFWTRP